MSDRARNLLARYLQQRREIGEIEIVFSQDVHEVLSAIAAAPAAPIATPVAATVHPEPSAPAATRSLQVLGETAGKCTACRLAETRSTVVFGEGDPAARVVVVGEAPGAEEDRTGRPFVGRAGKLLDQLLASSGFPRETVYICNVLKCRPPGNRNPQPDEVESCNPFLKGQLQTIGPSAILACGTFPAQTLLGTSQPIGRLRRSSQSYEGIPLIATYHPAALLRNPSWIRPVWADLQRLRQIVDEADVE
ncbi:MAG: uracil-DNA glycosylase [Gemmatimonas sp.]|nr:uracil-DNA glycosylase [Gemmatimonas sp.]